MLAEHAKDFLQLAYATAYDGTYCEAFEWWHDEYCDGAGGEEGGGDARGAEADAHVYAP